MIAFCLTDILEFFYHFIYSLEHSWEFVFNYIEHDRFINIEIVVSDNITYWLGENKYNACKYLPYGPVKDVVPYLTRRAQENTSVAGQTGRELSLIQKELERRRKEK